MRQTRKYSPGPGARQAELLDASASPDGTPFSCRRTSSDFGCVGRFRRIHSSNPPWSTPTRSYPRLIRIRARLALVASPGQVQ